MGEGIKGDIPDIAGTVIKAKEKHIEVWPVKSNYASEAGHPCERYLFYQRTAWEQKTPHNVTLQFIFEGGNMIEAAAIRELQDAGFNVVEQARYFQWKEFELSGKVDARIQVNGHLPPLEIKGINHREWSTLETVDDMLDSGAPWVRRYPAQILTYQLMSEEPLGFFYLKSKTTFVPKVIMVNLDDYLEYTEGILKKLERVNKAVRIAEAPERMEFEDKVCMDCAYFALCTPDTHMTEGAELMTNSELEEALDRREELKPLSKEYTEVDKYVKTVLKGVERAIIGDYLVTGQEVSGSRKPSPGGSFSYWKCNIARIPAGK